MKQEIHPEWYPQATVVCQCGNTWHTGATVEEIRTEICSACHPFYTGEQRIVDTEGRVDSFMRRLQQRDQLRKEREEAQASQTPADLPLEELGLNKRHLSILTENNITVVQDVLNVFSDKGDNGILDLSGLGQQALIDIKKGLRQRGYEIPEADEAGEE